LKVEKSNHTIFYIWEMLTALRAQNKDLKIELNNKYCIKKISV